MRKAFAGSVTLLMLAVVAQFFLAASGAYDTAPNDQSFQPHRLLGYGIVLLAVVVTIVGALARVPGRLVGLTGLVAGLSVVQVVIPAVAGAFGGSSTAGPLVFGLHAVNGLAIAAVLGMIVQRAVQLSRSARSARPAS